MKIIGTLSLALGSAAVGTVAGACLMQKMTTLGIVNQFRNEQTRDIWKEVINNEEAYAEGYITEAEYLMRDTELSMAFKTTTV